MGGGKGGRRKSGKSYPTRSGTSAGRKLVDCSGGVPLASSSSYIREGSTIQSGSPVKKETRLRSKAFGYTNPESSAAVDGAESFSVAFVNREPYRDQAVEVPSYAYHSSVVSGFGLGHSGEREDEEEEEAVPVQFKGDAMDALNNYSTPAISKSNFLTIGGVKIYTEDTSSPDEGEDELGSDDESSDSCERSIPVTDDSYTSNSGEEEEQDSDGSSDVDSCSDIDEELAEDYLEGIGGSSELLKAEWLTTVNLDKADKNGLIRTDGSRDRRDKLSGIALMNASKEYGMKKPRSKKGKDSARPRHFGSPVVDIDVSGLDNLLFVKDSRTGSGKRKQKRHSHLSQSWPGLAEAQKNKIYYSFPGGKKKHRKELIAMKRGQRMINRGVDLDQINKKLREMVINDGDMLSFQPMLSRDCSQVQRLASIYQLRSGSQGSGKRRFVTVTRTERTGLPSLKDKDRLDKLLGVGAVDEDFVINSGRLDKGRTKGDRRLGESNPRAETCHSAPSKFTKRKSGGHEKKQAARLSYAEKPVAFVSCGVMQADSSAEMTGSCLIEAKEAIEVPETSSSKLGAFEMHTRGFGSRMLTKMGFVEGSGLGKSGQGMVHPIEPTMRPKSLGLGVEFAQSATTEARVEKTVGLGAFEKHTKGFGSRMMTKMGFVPGSGLGKDAQGMIDPLTSVRRPKCRGLGAT